MMQPAIEFRDVDILFASGARGHAARLKQALQMVDQRRSRAEITAETGLVMGVSGASLSVAEGEISVLGLRKIHAAARRQRAE